MNASDQTLIVIDPTLLFWGLVIGLCLLLVLLILAALYQGGYETAKKEAAQQAAEREKQHQARMAVAGLQGIRSGSLRGQLDRISQEHLRNVANLTEEN
jgi:hypothetical protein